MTIVELLTSLVGTVPEHYQFILYGAALALGVCVCCLILSFFLGAISGLTYRFFK